MTSEYDLMVAPNGARLTKSDHPALPMTAQEIAQTAQKCAQAGANAIHVHVRDTQGQHALSPDLYQETFDHIASKTDIHVQASTEAAGVFDVTSQVHCLTHVTAKDVSLSLREIARDPSQFAQAYALAAARGIDVQHILYDPSDLDALLTHFESGEIPETSRRAIFVLGRYSERQISSPRDLAPFLKRMGSAPLNWSVCAFGQTEQSCLLAALDQGGNVRIGFENNRLAPNGTPFPNNETSVASFVYAAEKAGFQPKQVHS